ncbi:hypothetical protein BV22DRAFT_972870, partial [Leucogyrophana mollusca]
LSTGVTRTYVARAENSSEAVSLQGHKALTPVLAGSICGGVIGIAWIVGLIWYLVRRRKRRQLEA